MKKKFYISGMTCASCVSHVKRSVSSLDGVSSCDVSLLTNQMDVEYNDISEKMIIDAVSKAGYKASLTSPENKSHNTLVTKLIIAGVLLLVLMFFAMYHMFNIPNLHIQPIVNSSIQWVISSIIIALFFNYFINGFKRLFQLAPNMDTLIAIGSTASYCYAVYFWVLILIATINNDQSLAHSLSHNLFFDSSAMILVFTTIGKMLEGRSKQKALMSVEDLVNIVPNTCTKIVEGQEVTVDISDVNIGDILVSKVGDIIALDGEVIYGVASINEATITGEPNSVYKNIGDNVISGTLLVDGIIKYKVQSTKDNSTISMITKRVIEAANSKPKIEKFADKVASYFVPFVIGVALITFLIWIIASKDFTKSINFGICVLVVSCPCALGLATPVAIMVASGVGAKNHLLFKDSNILEELTKIDTIFLDKTGTITNGKPQVIDYKCSIPDEEFFRILYSLEINSKHPIATSIIEYCSKYNFKEYEVNSYTNEIGFGISGEINKRRYWCGNSKYIEQLKLNNPYENINGTTLYLFTENEVIGYVLFNDEINENSFNAITNFRKLGIEVCVLTGDTLESANSSLKDLNISHIYASLLPSDKEEIVTKYQSEGKKVMMIGDGINDSIALSKANVGVGLSSGTNVSVDSSDLVLARHNLMDVYYAILLGKKTFTIIKENLFWAFCYNIIGIPIAAGALSGLGITLTPMLASIFMSFSSILVVSNALRIQMFNRKECSNMYELKISVPSMMCKHCEARVIEAIKKIDGVLDVKVDLKKKIVLIKSNVEIAFIDVANILKNAGYEAKTI